MITHPTWDKDAHWVRVYRARIRLGWEKCRLCGCVDRFGTGQQLTLDHIRPRSKGWASDMSNATILCQDENNTKADGDPRHTVSLLDEEAKRSRRERWSLRPVPELPAELSGARVFRYQPARSLKSRRRVLRRALPHWAPAAWLDVPPGEPIPDYVLNLIKIHNGDVPVHVRLLMAG